MSFFDKIKTLLGGEKKTHKLEKGEGVAVAKKTRKPVLETLKPAKKAVKELKVEKPKAVKPEAMSKEERVAEEEKLPMPAIKKEGVKLAGILKEPHITEKASDLVALNQYVFKVSERASKHQIKRAVESLYGVRVKRIQILNVHPKKRRLGRTSGWKKGYRKAIVRLAEGDKIELMPR